MLSNTEIVFADHRRFASKRALYTDIKRSELTEKDEIKLILESLILNKVSEEELGNEEISIDIDEIALHYVKSMHKYKTIFEENRNVVRKNKFGIAQNHTINDYLKGIEIRRGRPAKNHSEKDKFEIQYGKLYMHAYSKDLNLCIVNKINARHDFIEKEGIVNYSIVLNEDKIVLRKV